MSMESLVKELSELYKNYGYAPYTMNKFEEYELYLRNKDFLISDRILTFTDTDGKLMALKPDVTLSIIKNTEDSADGCHKVYYRENVYRPGKSDQGFREIMQVGLECMGKVDNYCILEVLLLAVQSLRAISKQCVLDISHMGLLSILLDRAGLTGPAKDNALTAIGSKNVHELRKICEEAGAPWQQIAQVTTLCGRAQNVLVQLEPIFEGVPEFAQFKLLVDALSNMGVDCVNIDFSVINDMNYYNGIVFRGFVEGVPAGILSGGQYDAMMTKMKRSGSAIGFALYPDLLERIMEPENNDRMDAVLLYDETADLLALAKAVEELARKGIKISAQPGTGTFVSADKIYRLIGNEVQCIG